MLISMRVLTMMDVASFVALCVVYSDWKSAWNDKQAYGAWYNEERFDKEGNVVGSVPRRHPAAVEEADTWRRFVLACGLFGMNPAQRSRLRIAGEPEAVDPFEEMFGRKA